MQIVDMNAVQSPNFAFKNGCYVYHIYIYIHSVKFPQENQMSVDGCFLGAQPVTWLIM